MFNNKLFSMNLFRSLQFDSFQRRSLVAPLAGARYGGTMKTIAMFVIFITLLFQVGCKHATQPTLSKMYVSFDVESAFQNDSVKVVLDDNIILEARVTTNYSISLAWSSGLRQLSKESHKLNFSVIESGAENNYAVDATNDTSTVVISFNNSMKEISFGQRKGIIYRR
jgi:hypothetical protein